MPDTKLETPPHRLRDEPPSQHKSQKRPQIPVVTSGTHARQGRWGWPVLAVLLAGLTLAVIVGTIIGMLMF